MPNIKSAKKKVLVINRRKQENRYVKSTIATMTKNFRAVVKEDYTQAEKMLRDIISYIDSAKSKGVIHANNASRKVARLNILLDKAKKQSVVLPSENTKEEVKAEVKEGTTTKNSVTEKKPSAKKTVTKTTKKKAE